MSREMTSHGFSHLDEQGRARMVDVGGKEISRRRAVARAEVRMSPATLEAVLSGAIAKGDVLAASRLAGIAAAKRTGELIPLCHPLGLDAVAVRFSRLDPGVLGIEAEAAVTARTGVEMEALTAAAVAGLTVYDMCKAVDRAMVIGEVRLVAKEGGRSGGYRREGEEQWPQWI
jgi:cyclic pyranopterin monophosphate synthase